MRAGVSSNPSVSGSLILAQRASGPFRVAICRERSESPDITVRLDRLDEQTLAYEPVCSFASAEWGQAMRLLVDLGDAIPEASRALDAEASQLLGAGLGASS
jgi:hypothetical protein